MSIQIIWTFESSGCQFNSFESIDNLNILKVKKLRYMTSEDVYWNVSNPLIKQIDNKNPLFLKTKLRTVENYKKNE